MQRIATALVTLLAPVAAAQTPNPSDAIIIEIDRPVLEPGESAVVTMRAGFGGPIGFCMGTVVTDLLADRDPAMFDDPRLLPPMDTICPGSPLEFGECRPGTLAPGRVEGIIGGQLHFGGMGGGITGDSSNPIGFWSARLEAPDALAEPVQVALATRTTSYTVYLRSDTSEWEERVDRLTEGHATLTIVPCRADFNGDGTADLFDFLAFQNAFVAGEELADFDFDGELTLFDFLAFQDRFDQGCP